VILVDDGLGTGLMQLAAITALRRLHVAGCVVATPLATPAATERVARRVDQVLVLRSEEGAPANGRGRWRQPLDDETAAALLEFYRQPGGDAS
jgi:putative phosphoribosyl transferase